MYVVEVISNASNASDYSSNFFHYVVDNIAVSWGSLVEVLTEVSLIIV